MNFHPASRYIVGIKNLFNRHIIFARHALSKVRRRIGKRAADPRYKTFDASSALSNDILSNYKLDRNLEHYTVDNLSKLYNQSLSLNKRSIKIGTFTSSIYILLLMTAYDISPVITIAGVRLETIKFLREPLLILSAIFGAYTSILSLSGTIIESFLRNAIKARIPDAHHGFYEMLFPNEITLPITAIGHLLTHAAKGLAFNGAQNGLSTKNSIAIISLYVVLVILFVLVFITVLSILLLIHIMVLLDVWKNPSYNIFITLTSVGMVLFVDALTIIMSILVLTPMRLVNYDFIMDMIKAQAVSETALSQVIDRAFEDAYKKSGRDTATKARSGSSAKNQI